MKIVKLYCLKVTITLLLGWNWFRESIHRVTLRSNTARHSQAWCLPDPLHCLEQPSTCHRTFPHSLNSKDTCQTIRTFVRFDEQYHFSEIKAPES